MISRPVLHSSKGFLPLFLNHIKDFSFGIETQWSSPYSANMILRILDTGRPFLLLLPYWRREM